MSVAAIDIHDIESGLDRVLLTRLRERFLHINQLRHQRTHAELSDRQQAFLELLPLLFHVNHPMLPGYISHKAPCGVHGYEPNKDTVRRAKKLARSYRYIKDVRERTSAIDAIFLMGSVGTIAHSDQSDFDIWICHSDQLSGRELADLQLKCQQLTLWAQQNAHMEVHFFPMNDRQFRSGSLDTLSHEGSGSAQNMLLLDEFYRTSIWLAGKLPLWWFVPVSQEHNYEEYTNVLVGRRFIDGRNLIDFGPLPNIPANEFLGAGVWQLYKAIGSPYKSILKLQLLEAYASNPDAPSLAIVFKQRIYDGDTDPDELDPYVMVYRHIEVYLQDQPKRLELARRCFYFKVGKPLTRLGRGRRKSWQRKLLEALVAQWRWPKHHLHLLDCRNQWRAPQVIAERAVLVRELSACYRLLNSIHKAQPSPPRIRDEEMMLLGRKLHAAFERKAGKIDAINPGISKGLSEAELCFSQSEVAERGQWSVYLCGKKDLLKEQPPTPVRHGRGLVELILWTQINGLLDDATRVDLYGGEYQLTGAQLQWALRSLRNWLPNPLDEQDEHNRFISQATPEKVLLILNLGHEPQRELQERGLQMLSEKDDALGYSGLKENLILSADVAMANSWGEIICRHFDADALVNALLYCLRLLPTQRTQALPEMTIHCFNAGKGHLITRRMQQLWDDLTDFYCNRPETGRYLIETAEEWLLVQFVQQQPILFRFREIPSLMEKLSEPQTAYSPLLLDARALPNHPLKLISEAAAKPGVYLFFQAQGDCADIYLIDQKGSLFFRQQPYRDTPSLLRPLHRFLRAVLARQNVGEQLAPNKLAPPVAMYEICSTRSGTAKGFNGRLYLEKRSVTGDLSQVNFVNVQAIAEPDHQGGISYSFYCDDEEFSALQYGAAVYNAVARHIRDLRTGAEEYPCYITDLDLSQCREILAPVGELQLIHYLTVKTELENRFAEC